MILLIQTAEADGDVEGEELQLPADLPLTPDEEEEVKQILLYYSCWRLANIAIENGFVHSTPPKPTQFDYVIVTYFREARGVDFHIQLRKYLGREWSTRSKCEIARLQEMAEKCAPRQRRARRLLLAGTYRSCFITSEQCEVLLEEYIDWCYNTTEVV